MEIVTPSASGSSGPLQIIRDGNPTAINKDTAVPGNTIPLPVEIVSASGQEVTINIANGDIDMQSTHTGANYDSMRIGDGTTLWAIEAGTGAGLVKITSSVLPTGAATSANQATEIASLSSLDTKSTAANTSLSSIDTKLSSQATAAAQAAEAVLIGAVTETAPASDTASSGLNGRLQRIAQRITSLIALLPVSIGQKSKAGSISVALASDTDILTTKAQSTYTTSFVTAAATGDMTGGHDINEYSQLFFTKSNGAVATMKIMVSIDNVNYYQAKIYSLDGTAQDTISADGLYYCYPPRYYKPNITAYTSGTVWFTGWIPSIVRNQVQLPVGAATATAQAAEAVLIGAVTETAPASDTASSGLNGRLQRIAQNITTLIAATLKFAMQTQVATTVKQAKITVGTTAVRCTTDGAAPSATRRFLSVQPSPDTASARFWVGSSSVTSTGATMGIEVFPAEKWEREFDAGEYYIISDTAAQNVQIVEQE